MKKALLVLASLLPLVWGSPALAGHDDRSESGTVSFPNPLSAAVGGVTENVASCDPSSDLQGFDGHWIDITGFGGHTARIDPVEADADFDGWFYDTDCGLILDAEGGSPLVQTGPGENEVGTIPSNARWVVVDLFLAGGESSFTFTAS